MTSDGDTNRLRALFDPDRFRRVDTIFDAALDLPDGERAAYIDAACSGDDALRSEVMAMLDTAGAAEAAFGENVAEFAGPLLSLLSADDDDDPPLTAGALVGPWRIMEEIGRGGMGAVYRAARADGAFERDVAVKVVKRGMDTADVLRRFRAERRILAALDHPNIARLLDGGAMPDGRPWIVMEYVEGERIDRWCDAQRLDQRARVRLFRDVCEAVHQAHRRLIVHRDIKPSNVLVTREGVPKLLDFGIAKLLDRDDDDETTVAGVRLLTPEYAAPEQLTGQPITPATDVYALGRLLQRLLAGAGPVRGDLATIVQRAVAPEPARRYGFAQQFAEDLDRWLRGMPVSARPDSVAYRTRMFVRRHRAGVAVATVAVGVLITFAASMAAAQQRTASALTRAETERDTAEEVARVLEEIFTAGDPTAPRAERRDTLRVAALLDRSAARVRSDLADRPRVQARLLRALGDAYRGLGLFDESATALGEAVAAQRLTDDSVALARVLNSLGGLELARERNVEAEQHLREAVDLYRRHLNDTNSNRITGISNLAAARQNQGDFDGAALLYDEALAALDRSASPDTALLASVLNGRGMLAQRAGDFDTSADIAERILDIERARLGPVHPRVAVSLNNVAFTRMQAGRLDEADSLFAQGLVIIRATLGEAHPLYIDALSAMANVRARRGLHAEARPLFEDALARDLALRGPDFAGRAITLSQYADMLVADGAQGEAEAAVAEAIGINRRALGPQHAAVGITTAQLARLRCARGALEDGERLFREALIILEAALPPTHPRIADVRGALERCTGRTGGDAIRR